VRLTRLRNLDGIVRVAVELGLPVFGVGDAFAWTTGPLVLDEARGPALRLRKDFANVDFGEFLNIVIEVHPEDAVVSIISVLDKILHSGSPLR
jgi:hypothetical protein